MILVTGANGVVGTPLCEDLLNRNIHHIKISRFNPDSNKSIIKWDLDKPINDQIKKQLTSVATIIHCAPIWLLPKHLIDLNECGITRAIVFSSTSVVSKTKSSNLQEQHLVELLSTSENELFSLCIKDGIALTILRPSMIYGYTRDQNVMKIAGFIKRFGFIFLVGEAKGLRQPIHASDLVDVAINILGDKETYGKTYNIAGGEIITYREMVERIFIGLHRKVKIISLPLFLYRFALLIAARLTKFSFTPEMANRMNQDLNYDTSDAKNDFSFEPQKFLTSPERDLIIKK